MNTQELRRVQSADISTESDKLVDLLITNANTVEKVECSCCGHTEDCTSNYINDVKDSHIGKWVCGLCSEAVKDKLLKAPGPTLEEAVSAHTEFCQKFNKTTRLNPKLSLAWAMKDIAKRSSQQRASMNSSSMPPKIARTSSCFASIRQE